MYPLQRPTQFPPRVLAPEHEASPCGRVCQKEFEALQAYGVDLTDRIHQQGLTRELEEERSQCLKPWVKSMMEQMEWDQIPFQQCNSAETWNNSDFLFEVREGIAYCTLNDVGNNNSFSGPIVSGFLDAAKIMRSRPDIRVAVLTGNGRMFCAGGDPRGFQAEQRAAGVIGAAASGGERSKVKRPPQTSHEAAAESRDVKAEQEREDEAGANACQLKGEHGVKFSGKWPPRGGAGESWESMPQGGPPGPYISTFFEQQGKDANIKSGFRAAWHFFAWASIPQFSICCQNGSAMGGALGILGGSDYVVCVKTAFSVLSEVRLGVIPAVVSPHVIRCVGASNAKRIFVQAENLNAVKALDIGLIQRIVAHEREFPGVVKELVDKIQMTNSNAVRWAKAAIFSQLNQPMSEAMIEWGTAEYVRIRKTEECNIGIESVNERKTTPWEGKKIDCKLDSVKADPANMPVFAAFMQPQAPPEQPKEEIQQQAPEGEQG